MLYEVITAVVELAADSVQSQAGPAPLAPDIDCRAPQRRGVGRFGERLVERIADRPGRKRRGAQRESYNFV